MQTNATLQLACLFDEDLKMKTQTLHLITAREVGAAQW